MVYRCVAVDERMAYLAGAIHFSYKERLPCCDLRIVNHFPSQRINGARTMIDYERGLYIRIQELDNGPRPLPLNSGFSRDRSYRVLGLYNPSETGECWLILSNDIDQIWHISQRHVRTVGLDQNSTSLRNNISASP